MGQHYRTPPGATPDATPELPTLVIGAGLAGLAAAWRLQQGGQSYVLCEAGDRLGGVAATIHRDGFLMECGPDSFLTNKPAAAELCRELGLDGAMIATLPSAGGPSLWTGRAMTPLDVGAVRNLSASVAPGDESVAQYLRRTLGDERGQAILDNPVAPMLAGVYGGDAERLSAECWLGARQRTGSTLVTFTSLRAGMGQLVAALEHHLPPTSIRRGCSLTALRPAANGFLVALADGTQLAAARVVMATPAWAAAELLRPCYAALADLLADIPCASSVNVNVAFPASVPVPPGHGFLAARAAAPLLACTFAHQKFAGRASAGASLLRLFYGEEAFSWPQARLHRQVRDDLQSALGISTAPAWLHVTRCPRAMPQYTVGHRARVAAITAACPPGLALAGNAYRGVGVPDVLAEAR